MEVARKSLKVIGEMFGLGRRLRPGKRP